MTYSPRGLLVEVCHPLFAKQENLVGESNGKDRMAGLGRSPIKIIDLSITFAVRLENVKNPY
jgi:hypothetical protein